MALGLGLREWGLAEWVAAIGAALPRSRAPVLQAAVAGWFERAFARPAAAVDSGSTALVLALRCLQALQPGRDQVVIPALACPAVSRSCAALNLRMVHADIGADLNTPVETVRGLLGPQTLAVVMVHAYGHPCDAAGLHALCTQRGVGLIDDAAQRIDPASGLGTSGDFGVFSFAQSKSVVCGIGRAGGVLLVNCADHAAWLRAEVDRMGTPNTRWLDWIEFALTPSAPRAAYHLARWRGQRAGAAAPPPQVLSRLGEQEAAIALVQLRSRGERFERRRCVLAAYRDALRAAGVDAPQLGETIDYVARLMVRVRAEQRQACRQALAKQAVETRLPYTLPANLGEGCVNARRLAAELLELPLPRRLSAGDAQRIARLVAPFAAPVAN